jgi:hypothetical protein
MFPVPEQPAGIDPEAIDHFFDTWCNLAWTDWIPFAAPKEEFRAIPGEPGLYRIRPVGKEFLMYIGETRRTLHHRLHDLRIELGKSVQMPWSDPHTEAPALWAWQDADRYQYECSAAPLDASDSGRRGMENFLLYRYRQEYGESPLCSLGRFHPRYRRSSTRKEGLRGARLLEGQKDNPAGEPGRVPLCPSGAPGDRDWMGLAWSAPAPLDGEHLAGVPGGQGLYILIDAPSREVIFITRTETCSGQLAGEAGKAREGGVPLFSFHAMEELVLPHQLRELETDLVGNYYEQFRKGPKFQFRGSSRGACDPGTE